MTEKKQSNTFTPETSQLSNTNFNEPYIGPVPNAIIDEVKKVFSSLIIKPFNIETAATQLATALNLSNEAIQKALNLSFDFLFADVKTFLEQIKIKKSKFVLWTKGDFGNLDFINTETIISSSNKPFQHLKIEKSDLSELVLNHYEPDEDCIFGGEEKCTVEIFNKIVLFCKNHNLNRIVVIDDEDDNIDKVKELFKTFEHIDITVTVLKIQRKTTLKDNTENTVDVINSLPTEVTENTLYVLDFDRTLFDTDEMKDMWFYEIARLCYWNKQESTSP